MKSLIVAITLFSSGLTYAFQSNLGEVDLKDCECKQCLIDNGVCVRTQTNGERYISDKNLGRKPKGKKAGPAGANKG